MMGLYVANLSFQPATRHHPADVAPRSMFPRPCRVHNRSGRMRCVAAAPSMVDSKTRPGEKKGNGVICTIKQSSFSLYLEPRPLYHCWA